VVLQLGIRAKVSTLSLDGLVEWSLDRGCEEKLCLEDQFQTLVNSGGIAVCETAVGVVYGHRGRGLHTNSAGALGSVQEGR
jgi:hypothetical protein